MQKYAFLTICIKNKAVKKWFNYNDSLKKGKNPSVNFGNLHFTRMTW